MSTIAFAPFEDGVVEFGTTAASTTQWSAMPQVPALNLTLTLTLTRRILPLPLALALPLNQPLTDYPNPNLNPNPNLTPTRCPMCPRR